MRPINKKCVILSAELSENDAKLNVHNTDMLDVQLKRLGLPYKDLLGCYKTRTESSFLVEYDELWELTELLKLAEFYDQESMLLLDQDRNATLFYSNINTENIKLGKLRDISFNVAKELDAWSYCPVNDQYYGVL